MVLKGSCSYFPGKFGKNTAIWVSPLVTWPPIFSDHVIFNCWQYKKYKIIPSYTWNCIVMILISVSIFSNICWPFVFTFLMLFPMSFVCLFPIKLLTFSWSYVSQIISYFPNLLMCPIIWRALIVFSLFVNPRLEGDVDSKLLSIRGMGKHHFKVEIQHS